MRRQLVRRHTPLESHILTFEDLQALSGATDAADVMKWADAEGIRYGHVCGNGIWTTVAALNFALGVSEAPPEKKLHVEDVFG